MKWFKSSISRKLISIVFISIILIFSIFGLILNNKVKFFFEQETKESLLKDSKYLASELDTFFESKGVLVEQMATNSDFIEIIEEVSDRYVKRENPKYYRVAEQLNKIKQSDENLSLVWIGLSDASDLITDMAEYDAADDYRIREKGWYKETISNGQLTYSQPYVDAVTGKLVISVIKPIYKDGRDIGVVAIDLLIDEVGRVLKEYKIGKNGYAILITNDGTVVYHPDESQILNSNMTDMDGKLGEIGKLMIQGRSGIDSYEYEGVKKFFGYSSIKSNSWSIGTNIEASETEVRVNSFIRENMIVVSLFGLILIGIIYVMVKMILKPIPKILDGMQKFAYGDLSCRIDMDSEDEIGMIGQSFNNLVRSISDMIVKIKRSSDEMQNASNVLVDVSEYSKEALDEISKAVSEVAGATVEQADDTQKSVSEVHSFGEQIENIFLSTMQIYENTENASKLSVQGALTLKQLSDKSLENQESVNNIKSIVNEMDKSTDEITSIIEMINAISEQTNLLALNASIEAARAGEAGKGFAVVAEEIRKLAEQTSEATDDIRNKILNIQEKSKSAVVHTESSEEIAKNNESMVLETQSIFKDIQSNLENLFRITEDTKAYGEKMKVNKDEMIGLVENISASVEETSASMEEVSANTESQKASIENLADESQKLKVMAGELEELLKEFNI